MSIRPEYSRYNCLRNGVCTPEDIPGIIGQSFLHKFAQQTTREDYENGNTEVVNGWLLSRNELELFALVVLADERQTAL